MKWRRGVGGGQVEDRRGMGLPIGVGGGGLGIVGLLIAILLGGGVVGGGGSDEGAAPSDEVEFVRFVVNDVQTSWETEFRAQSRNYEPTQLVLFSQATSTGCGLASSQTGPFY